MQLIHKGLTTFYFFHFLFKFISTFSFYTDKEINFKTLCMLLLSKGAEVLDRYNTFCINLKQGCLTVFCCYYLIFESLGGPQTQHPALQWIHRRKPWLSGMPGISVVTVTFWGFMWAVAFLFGVGTE